MSEPRSIRIAAVQMAPERGEVTANRERIVARMREAAAAGARLVVFPECALTGYVFDSKDEAFAFAEPIPGPSLIAISIECALRHTFAVVGLLERDRDRLYNACALVGAGGVIASYRKVHLPYLGVDRFADPGDRPFAVHAAVGLKIGMHICYDASFPETGRVLSLLGADVLVLPTNWPTHAETTAEHLTACRAMENAVYALAANRVGEERGFRFIGRSSIAGPGGEILARAGADTEEILYADVDPQRARNKRLVRVPGLHEIDRFADRRPGFYGRLTQTD